MGSVYEAKKEVDGFPMRVALKIIRFAHSSPYLLRRFRMERQILARLQSEYILRMIDGGVTQDGLPYLVTEYLRGRTCRSGWRRSGRNCGRSWSCSPRFAKGWRRRTAA